MSEDTIAVIISAATLLVSLLAGFGWTIHRMDGLRQELGGEINGLRQELGGEINGLRQELGGEINGLRQELGDVETRIRKDLGGEIRGLGDRITGVERELVEVKIAVARLEGPGRHLVASR